MMRTIEVLIVIIIITGAFIAASYFAVLPWPRQVSPMNLRRLSFTTLQLLDSDYALSDAAFQTDNATLWGGLQVALSASLPPNVIYNLTVYDVSQGATSQLYVPVASISNAESLGATSDASSYLVASSNVTFNVVPEKIGEHSGGGTLYILNCSDANGWWITGYTAQGLAQDLYNLLSPYFVNTIMVQNTTQLWRILNNNTLIGETLQNAVIINTFGEAVPIPSAYCTTPYSNDNYAYYFYFLGQRVRAYNWTWASIVGYPFYYVTNTGNFTGQSDQAWGIYGIKSVAQRGCYAFLQGLTDKTYSASDSSNIYQDVGVVNLSSQVLENCNYYGIYPSSSQTSTRAIQKSKLTTYTNLTVGLLMFDEKSGCYPGALYNYRSGTRIDGSLLVLGLTRTPDIRLTALGLLSYYKPRLYRSEYTANGTSRLVVLQLGLVGGV
ncbi:hypothetical protein G4O51_05045 [Candidatus Bathyarchaeota archaeon A05DMB-2]|jgi:hypothetical protein|nr:hypothetical protein [Candidatus Bathyarchaeota archaeon A05DMB-2]